MKVINLPGPHYKTASDEDNYYVISASGMIVIRKSDEQVIASGTTVRNLTDIWTDNSTNFIYMSSSGTGVVVVDKGWLNLVDISDKFYTKYSVPDITSDEVLCIDGNSNTELLIGTTSGVDLVTPSGIFSSTSLSPVTEVCIVDSRKLFYAGAFGLAGELEGDIQSNWTDTSLSFIIDETTVPAITKLPIQDIDIIEDETYITIGLATSSGVEVINNIKGSDLVTSSVLQLFTRS